LDIIVVSSFTLKLSRCAAVVLSAGPRRAVVKRSASPARLLGWE